MNTLNPGYIHQDFIKNWDDKELSRNIDTLTVQIKNAETLVRLMIEERDRRVAAGRKL